MNARGYVWVVPIFFSVFTLCTACGPNKQTSGAKTPLYFPMSSFTAQQAHLLEEKGRAFEKKALLDGDSSRHTVQYDSAGWMKALQAWTALDINKPRLQGQYLADTLQHALRRTLRYTRKKDVPYAVQELVIQMDSLAHVRAISGSLEENKRLYRSLGKLHARFSPQGILEGYTLWGYQKMLLSDTVHYRITLQHIP